MRAKRSGDHLEDTIAATCRLIGGRSGLRQVIVLSDRRLTADEYQRLQQAAAARVDLWTTAAGVTRLRPRAVAASRLGGAKDQPGPLVD